MPKHSSKNFHEADHELHQQVIVEEDIRNSVWDPCDWSCCCYNNYYMKYGCICSDCKASRLRKKKLETIKPHYTPQQIMDVYMQHYNEKKDCCSESGMNYVLEKLKKESYKQILNHSTDIQPLEIKGISLEDIPYCVQDILYEEYEDALATEHKERNRQRKLREKKRRAVV